MRLVEDGTFLAATVNIIASIAAAATAAAAGLAAGTLP